MPATRVLRHSMLRLYAGAALCALLPSAAYAQAYSAGGGTATGGNAVAIGSGANAPGNGGVAIGQTAIAAQTGSTSVGLNTQATQTGATALGNAASATGNSATAIGSGSTATGQNATAIGFGAAATGTSVTSVGDSAGTSMGTGSFANTSVGFVAGQNVTGNYNSGFGASAGQYVAGNYNTGVGAGAGVFVTGDANYASGLQAGQNVQGNANVAIGYNAGSGTTATPLAASSTVSIGSVAHAGGNNAVAIGRQSTADAVNAFAGGAGSNASGASSVALGDGAAATYTNGVAIGSGSVTGSAAPTGAGFLTGSAAPASEVSIGSSSMTRRLTNVSDGSAPTDAVTVAQLMAENVKVDAQGVATASGLGGNASYDPTTGAISAPSYTIGGGSYGSVGSALSAVNTIVGTQGTSIAAQLGGGAAYNTATGTVSGGTYKAGSSGGTYATVADALANIASGGSDPDAVHYDDAGRQTVTLAGTGGTTLTNVKAGTISSTSTDAVNGSQLAQAKADITTNINNLNALTASLIGGTIGLVEQAGGAPGSGQITIGAGTGGTSVSIAGTSGNRTLSGVAAGVIATDAVNVGQLNADIGGIAATGVQYDDSSHTSITLNPGAVAAGLHNVASGLVTNGSTDAVNGGQLYATNQQVAANSAGIAGNTIAITALNNGTAGPFQVNNSNNRAAPVATGQDAVAGGFGAMATVKNATALGNAASATGQNSVVLGYGSTDGGVANVVSVGAPGAERQITNVAAGTRTTDAVNLGQLTSGLAGTLASANAYTDGRINALNYDLSRARRDAASGTAAAMAMASLPQAFTPGAGMIAGGISAYRDQTAFAFGASKAFNDGHTIVKASGTVDTRGTAGAAVGVGYQF